MSNALMNNLESINRSLRFIVEIGIKVISGIWTNLKPKLVITLRNEIINLDEIEFYENLCVIYIYNLIILSEKLNLF